MSGLVDRLQVLLAGKKFERSDCLFLGHLIGLCLVCWVSFK